VTPDDGYGTPDANYTTPDDVHYTPDHGHHSPDFGYDTPDDGFTSPDDHFSSPDFGYQTPDHGQHSPDFGYHSPDHGFTSLDDHFSSPDFVYQTPEVPAPDPQYVPVIRTLDVRFAENGDPLLEGRVMADGGSEMLEVGLIVGEAKSGEEIRMVAELDPQTGEFQLRLEGLAPGRYAYRAYGINGVGETLGSSRSFEKPGDAISDSSALQAVEMASGWMRSPWFGAFRDYGNGWIFHTRLGWLFLSEDGSGGIWLWMESEGWLWAQPGVWPFLWKDGASDWLYLIEAPEGRTYLYDYSLGVTRSVE
ncbi:MAG: hypothetical protein VXX20_03885, partial [Verrucomicrobiota bacterium]|nr:hypothetical protein [Verrucomicrobiota bacterium]